LTSPQKTSPYSRSKKNHRLTCGYTYYEEPFRLRNLIEAWKRWPGNVDIFLVDDGSEKYPALDVIKDLHFEDWQPTLQLWKVTRNLGFNSHGCRNLIAKYAQTDVIQFFDIDMIMHEGDIARLKSKIIEDDGIAHHRMYFSEDQTHQDHPGHFNCFAIHKDLFWKAGGYDESFTGHHYGDREFLQRVFALGPKKIKTDLIYTLDRRGKHGSVNPDVDKTEYRDEFHFDTPLPENEVKKLVGTVHTRLNFPFIKLIDL